MRRKPFGGTGRLPVFLALGLVALLPTTGLAGDDVVDRLTRGESLSCTPAYPVFCANIHFACSGHSRVPTEDLSVVLVGDSAVLTPTTATGDAATRRGPARFGERDAYLLVRFEPARDYFKVEADGRYSHRIYRRGGALMSRGTCR